MNASNWQTPPHHRWAFWNLDQFLPTRSIARSVAPRGLRDGDRSPELLATVITDSDGTARTVGEVLHNTTDTDGYVIVHDGTVIAEWYREPGTREGRHALMSVTKSFVGVVAGILVGRGLLDMSRPVTDYAPELALSGYAGARVRDVADMRSGVNFREDYHDPTSDIAVMADWLGWQTPAGAIAPSGLYGFLQGVGPADGAGGRFDYRSSDTDVLGWVCERAAGVPMDVLIGDLLWRPMGAASDATMLCDVHGVPLHDGGLAVTARDLARFGMLLADGGIRRDLLAHNMTDDDVHVIPPEFMRATWTVDADVRGAFAASRSETAMPGGWYRNQFWMRPDARGADIMLGLGIFGQMLFVDRTSGCVAVKFSSWQTAQSPRQLESAFRAFGAISAAVGPATSPRPRLSPPGPSVPLL